MLTYDIWLEVDGRQIRRSNHYVNDMVDDTIRRYISMAENVRQKDGNRAFVSGKDFTY